MPQTPKNSTRKNGQKNTHLTKKNIKMANKHMKKCSRSFVIKVLQIKTMTYYCRSIRMAKTQNPNTGAANAAEDREQKCSLIAGGNTKWYGYLERQPGSFL